MSWHNLDSICEEIKSASQQVREILGSVGSHAHYLWPEKAGQSICKGYSYDIPKEEQIRSAYWLAFHGTNRVICELEWNVYESRGKVPRVKGEIDIVGYLIKSGDSRSCKAACS